jgi:hypothetical protein
MVVIIVALMLAFSISLAVGAIYGNRTLAQGHWAKQDIGAVLFRTACGFATRTLAQVNWAKDDVRYVVLSALCEFPTRTAPSGFWAKRNLGQVLLTGICGLAIRTSGTTTAQTASAIVATSGANWCTRDLQPGRWLVRNERIGRKATGSHRVVMARWAGRRKFRPVAKVKVGFCAWCAEPSVPSRRIRRERAGVRGFFLSKLAEKRAEEKEETLAVEAALAAEAAKVEGRVLARAAAKAEVRTAWLAARAARRAQAGRVGKLGALIGGEVTLTVQSWQRPAQATKVAMGKRLRSRRSGVPGLTKGQAWLRWAAGAAMSSPDIALQLEAELRRSVRLEEQYGVELVGEDARGFQAHRIAVAKRQRNAEKAARLQAHQARQAARAAERATQDWIKWQRDAVRMGLASPIVTKRPVLGQGIAAQAVVLPVLAEYLGFGLGTAIIGMLAAVAITAFLKFITKSKTNEAGECPELLAQWETTEEAAEAEAEAVRQDRNQLLIEAELMARFQEEAPTNEQVARWEAECEEDRLQYEAKQRELYEESDLCFRLGEHDGCARYEEAKTLSCGVRIRWAQAINSHDQWYVEQEAEVFSVAELPSALGCSLFLGYDYPNLEDQRWEVERALEKWIKQTPAPADESKHFTGDDELAWSQAMFDQWMHGCQAEEQAAAETAHLALGAGQSSLALILPVLASFMGMDLSHIVLGLAVGTIVTQFGSLFRTVGLGQLYLFWKNGEVPRNVSKAHRDTDVKPGLLLSYWAEAPVIGLNTARCVFEIKEEHLSELTQVDSGRMRFCQSGPDMHWEFSLGEYYVQDLISKDQVTCHVSFETFLTAVKVLEYLKVSRLDRDWLDFDSDEYLFLNELREELGIDLFEWREEDTLSDLRDFCEWIKGLKASYFTESHKYDTVEEMKIKGTEVPLCFFCMFSPIHTCPSYHEEVFMWRGDKDWGKYSSYSFALPLLAPVLGLDVDPLLVVAMVAMAWLISKVSPSFGGFALTLLAGATGYVGATVTGQEADNLHEEGQQGNQPHTDQEGLMVEEKEVAADRITELLQTVKADMEGCLRVQRTAEIQATLAVASATSMVRVLLGESLGMSMTYQRMFEWPRLTDDFVKQTYRAHIDSMTPDAMKARDLEVKLMDTYGISLFDLDECDLDCYKHSLHHIHRTPGSAATIDMHDIVKRALESLKVHGDLREVTIGELAKAWVTLNLIQTNFASEVMALNPASKDGGILMVNPLSKTSFTSIRGIYAKQLRGKGPAPTSIPTDIFLLYRNISSEVSEVEYPGPKLMMGMELASMAYRVREFMEATKAAKAQKYISQYFAPNLLGGRVIDFNHEHKLGEHSFTLKGISDAVLIVKPVSGESIFDAQTAKHLADDVYDGVVLVSRRLMALVLPSHMEEIRAGKLDGKVLIGRAYGFDFLIKGGFVIMPPQFMECTGKDMIAYGSKSEICSTWSKDRLTIILNSGVPKSDKGACTDTQTLINGFDLRDKEVKRIFTKIKDDAVEWLKGRLEDVRKGKIQMGELDSDILDIMSTDTDEEASEETVSELKDSSRLKEILGAMAKATGNGMALPQVVAPTMNQMTNQAMDPGRTRLPLAMFMENAKGLREYCKIAISVYPQVHYGLMIRKIAEALNIELDDATKALLTGYEKPMSKKKLKELIEEHLTPYGLTYDANRNVYCNPADYKKIMERTGTPLVSFFRNPSTVTSGAWGQLVPMECVPVGCYWVNPTPEAFTWFFANQDGGDLDDRMVMVIGELAISCILYHERKKKNLIAEKVTPFKEENSIKAKVAREFIKSQVGFMLRDDMDVSINADVTVTEEHEALVRELTGDDAADRILKNLSRFAKVDAGLYSFKEAMLKMRTAKDAFQSDRKVDYGSALANVSSVIGSLELMKGATGTAANVQMLMGAITQGLVHFGEGIDLDQKVRFISRAGQDELDKRLSEEEAAELSKLTYRDLTFLVMSEMLSNVIDADTQGQKVPEAAEVMEMIWSVSMYLGLAIFCEGRPEVIKAKTEGEMNFINFNMISLERMKFHFPGWLMKRGIGSFAAPFAGQSHMLQAGESALPKKVNPLHFAFEHTEVEGANSWVFEIFEDYMDQVLGIAHDEIMNTLNDGETPAWEALELSLQAHGEQVKEAADKCSKLNKLRMDGISFVHNMKLEPKRKRPALAAAEQAWLAKWNAEFPTQEGKLMFALWTLTKLVAAAAEKKSDATFTDRDSFVNQSRRSFGSISVKGLATHALYVGNLLDAEGQAVTNSQGLPEGPWLYTLAALNAMATSPAIATVNVFFSFAEEYKDLQTWHFGMVNGKPEFSMGNRPNTEAKTPMTTRDSFGSHKLDTEVYASLHSEVTGKTLAEVLTSGVLSVDEDQSSGKLGLSKNANFLINKRYSGWRNTKEGKGQDIKVFIEASKLQDYLVTGIEVVIDKKAAGAQYAHPSFNLKLQYTGPDRPLQGIDLSAFVESLRTEVTVYQGLCGPSDGREFQYWAQDKEEAKKYGSQIDSRKVNLSNFLIQRSKEGAVIYEELRSQHYAETGKPFDLLNPGENSNAFFTRVKAAGYFGISFLGTDESRYVVTFDSDGDNRTEDIDGYYRLPEKTVTLGVIGTAGRKERMTKEHFVFMVERTKKAIAAIKEATGAEAVRLVSGGAAWSDHVAVSLFIKGDVQAVSLHLGAQFETDGFTVKQANDAGDLLNKYHRQFSLAMTGGKSAGHSLSTIGNLVNQYYQDPRDERIQFTFQNGEIKGLFDRNTLIAKDSDFLIAFTFGEKGPIGGTKDTYDKYLAMGKKNARHVSLVGVTNDTPPVPPTKVDVPVKSSRRFNYGQAVIAEDDNFKSKDFEFMSNMYPCSVVLDWNCLEICDDNNNVFFHEIPEQMENVTFASSETLYQWIKCDILNREENTILPTDDGYTAKKKGRNFKASSPAILKSWNDAKADIMEFILESKFVSKANTMEGIELASKLYFATDAGRVCPVENNTWGDTFWGKCKGQGENHLGRALQRISLHPTVALAARYYVKNILKKS